MNRENSRATDHSFTFIVFCISFHNCLPWVKLIDTGNIESRCNTMQRSFNLVCYFEIKAPLNFKI